MKKNIHEIINNKEFVTAIRVPLFFLYLLVLWIFLYRVKIYCGTLIGLDL